MLVLVFPGVPALASMTSAEVYDAVTEHCPDKTQSHNAVSKSQVLAGDTVMSGHNDCNTSNCSDGNCVCQGPCQQLSSSATPALSNALKSTSSQNGDRKLLFSVLEIHLLANHYLPALRPPIC